MVNNIEKNQKCKKEPDIMGLENGIQNDTDNKFGLIYKNLDHLMFATFSAEPSMLGWETIYALIEGQLIIACLDKFNMILVFAGLLFSFFWLILVDINYKHQVYRSKAIEDMQALLKDYYKKEGLSFCTEDVCREQKLKWQVLGVMPINLIPEFIKNIPIRGRITSTWFYRKIVPIGLIIIWVLIWTSASPSG